jgi:Cu/Zn superoxide dismutase
MKRTRMAVPAVLLAIVALAVVAGASAKKPALSATPVFKLNLRGSQEVPQNKDQKGSAVGSVTFDLTRNSAGTITSGDVIFSFNYSFTSPTTVTGLHIHQGAKGATGPITIGAALSANDAADADGVGNITSVVTGTSPATLQAILDNPRAYYVNLHTPAHQGGALREQMHNPRPR